MNIHSALAMAKHQLIEDDISGKRQAILDAALELFAERGFHGTAVPLVAERAGVGAGTLYRYFESKESLVNTLYRHWKESLAREIFARISPTSPPREQFSDFWMLMGDFARRHPHVFEFLELHHHAPYLNHESNAIENHLLGAIETMIREAQRKQALKPVAPHVLMAIVNGAFAGLVKAARMGHVELTNATLVETGQVMWEAIRR